MNPRIQISVLLLFIGCFLAFFSGKENNKFRVKPPQLTEWITSDTLSLSVDEVVHIILDEKPGFTLIDVREEKEFRECTLPGAVNIPLRKLSSPENRDLLARKTGCNIFFSDGDEFSAAALTLSAGQGYINGKMMNGGMNAWFARVMNASFSGDRISSRENALLTSRFEAKRLFIQYNSMPDSMKARLFVNRQLERKKLDGGCE